MRRTFLMIAAAPWIITEWRCRVLASRSPYLVFLWGSLLVSALARAAAADKECQPRG